MSNLLTKYYRKPKAFISLPSKGKFYQLDESEQSMLEEVGVLPMTMLNQLSANNPESLVNGNTVEELIRDCSTITSVEPRKMFKCDIDALIMAIRMVSFEDAMNITMQCPKCNEEHTYGIDLAAMLSEATYHEELPYKMSLTENSDITLYLTPTTLESALKVDQMLFQDAKEIDMIRKSIPESNKETGKFENEEELKSYITNIQDIHRRMTMSTIDLFATSIVEAETPEGSTYDHDEITHFVSNLNEKDYALLKEKIEDINKIGIPKKRAFTCASCEHVFDGPVEVNPTDFFGNGSR